MVIMPSNVYLITSFQQICKLKQSDIVVVGIGSVLYKYYGAIKLICKRGIHGFESVCLLRLICRDLTYVSSCVYHSRNDIRFRIHR
jgi:hypothetical protein